MTENGKSNLGPGFKANPEHNLTLVHEEECLKVISRGQVILESSNVIRLKEGSYPDVFYFPIQDVKDGVLKPTEHETYCPFKGTASYWSILSNDGEIENAVWGYKKPYDKVIGLKDHISFYISKVDKITSLL